jgi:2-dehydro-3-deoxyphosphooctonate aldolase (KDO 8-P synthase)
MLDYNQLETNFFVMVGPNVIESYEHTLKIATELKNIMTELNILFIFKVSFDKTHRTSMSSYKRPGFEEGIEILKRIKSELNIPIIIDIFGSWQAHKVAEVADIIQIPAFLCTQDDLLKAAAKTNKIIHIKKGQFCSTDVMHKSVEKVRKFGNNKVLLCENGTMFGSNDLMVDPKNLLLLKNINNLVTMDITHCLQEPAQVQPDVSVKDAGSRKMLPYMGRIAVILGVNGIFMEVSDSPHDTQCDSSTQFPLSEFKSYINDLNKLRMYINGNLRLI